MNTYMTRCTLLERARNQYDSPAWEELIGFYRRYIYVIIRSMNVNHHDTEDILQQVLVKLWQHLADFEYNRDKCKFRYWITVITRNQVLEFVRKRKSDSNKHDRMRAENEADYLNTITTPDVEELATTEWKSFIANMAMQNIKPSFTDQAVSAFMLYTKGVSVADISTRLHVKPDSVYKYISRIKLKLINEINRLKVEEEF